MMTDPIADMLTRIRNGAASKHEAVMIPFSKLKFKLANLLFQEKYVGVVKEANVNGKPLIEVVLKYDADGNPLPAAERPCAECEFLIPTTADK